MTSPMNPNKALWEKGDFTRIAESMRESGEGFVKGLGITKGLKVLDLGCGDGTTALPAAKLGADVLGVDIASNLVAAGNKRAKDHGLTNCKFQEGDASSMQELRDQTFDLVVSIFGAMFAPRPFDVAMEMVRVTRPAGRIVMGNWIPNDPTLVAQVPRRDHAGRRDRRALRRALRTADRAGRDRAGARGPVLLFHPASPVDFLLMTPSGDCLPRPRRDRGRWQGGPPTYILFVCLGGPTPLAVVREQSPLGVIL